MWQTFGICALLLGIRRAEARFDETVASNISSLLATATVPYIIITCFSSAEASTLVFSRVASVVLLILFGLYHLQRSSSGITLDSESSNDEPNGDPSYTWRRIRRKSNPLAAFIIVMSAIVLTAPCALAMVEVINDTSTTTPFFVGFCLLPLLAELAEISKICWYAWRDNMDVALNVAALSGMHMTLFTAPVLCLLGWASVIPMDLSLDIFTVTMFSVDVWIFSYLVTNGKSNYLEGSMSLGL